MDYGFAVAVVSMDGKVLGYSAPLSMTKEELFNALKLGYDAFRVINTIVKQLGYKSPRNITVKTDEYEVTVFNRGTKLVFTVVPEEQIPLGKGVSTALAET